MRWLNDYTSGQRMWDADMYLVSGSNEVTVPQVFGGVTHSTASQIRGFTADGGTLKRYGSATLVTGINNTWVNAKVAHDANGNIVRQYINDVLKTAEPDRGNTTHYFKNGTCVGSIRSVRSECRFRSIKMRRR